MMLELNDKELEILYEGVKELMRKEQGPFLFSHADLVSLQTRLYPTKNIDTTSTNEAIDESLNEEVQVLDKVTFNKERGYVTGQIEGKFIVMVQGNTYLVDPKELKEFNTKPEISTEPHMKFDEVTQKLLLEQYVKCGIFQGNFPIKLDDCYVRYSHWEKAEPQQQIKVLIEGRSTFMPKSQVKVLANINEFANEENYIPGFIVDELSEEILENVLVNVIDYTGTIGDAESVQIIQRLADGTQEIQSFPKSKLRI